MNIKTTLLGIIALYAVSAPVATLAQNPTLLTTINNPTPAIRDRFGWSLAALSSDLVVISAKLDDTGALNAGAAYLLRTNGAHLLTFTNPAPTSDDEFGCSVAVLGHDRVIIGAWKDERDAMTDLGLAYLFRTNGALLAIFTNPVPVKYDYFGFAVAAVGNDRVLIGASQDDTGAANAGAAYLFRTDGTLLTTLTNPAPAADDGFGWSLAAVGNDRVLISAYQDDTGATDAGTVYLFSIPAASTPRLAVNLSNSAVIVSWPLPAEGWVLEATNALPNLAAPWPQIPPPYQTNGANLQFIEPSPTGNKFYRLHKP